LNAYARRAAPRAARPLWTLALCAAFSAGLRGCAEFSPERTPPNLTARCVDEDTDRATAVSFRRDILEGIFMVRREVAPGCSCHDPNDNLPVGWQMSGLDLSSHSAALRGGTNTASTAVIPGRPCDSVLFLKVTPTPPLGARMPRNGPPFLSDAQIRLIHDWISEGARDN
jgi:hypothetical protein